MCRLKRTDATRGLMVRAASDRLTVGAGLLWLLSFI